VGHGHRLAACTENAPSGVICGDEEKLAIWADPGTALAPRRGGSNGVGIARPGLGKHPELLSVQRAPPHSTAMAVKYVFSY
jgi:hypothetical protein